MPKYSLIRSADPFRVIDPTVCSVLAILFKTKKTLLSRMSIRSRAFTQPMLPLADRSQSTDQKSNHRVCSCKPRTFFQRYRDEI